MAAIYEMYIKQCESKELYAWQWRKALCLLPDNFQK
jgi:hypothetical protein